MKNLPQRMTIKIANAVNTIGNWFAPKPKPIEMEKKIKASSSGSLIAALKRTIESAPTKPKESATEDFTMVIISMVVNAKIMKLAEKSFLFERLLATFW